MNLPNQSRGALRPGVAGAGGAIQPSAALGLAGVTHGELGFFNPWCVTRCMWSCQWAGGHRLWCWYVCSWLCRGRGFGAADSGAGTLDTGRID